MNWKNDKYKHMKHEILDIISKGFSEDDKKFLSLYIVFKSIDNLFIELDTHILSADTEKEKSI